MDCLLACGQSYKGSTTTLAAYCKQFSSQYDAGVVIHDRGVFRRFSAWLCLLFLLIKFIVWRPQFFSVFMRDDILLPCVSDVLKWSCHKRHIVVKCKNYDQ